MTPKLRRFLDQVRPSTPYLVVDVDVVEANYLALAQALDGVQIFYAVKANPAPEILARLAALGCSFDVASPAEIATGLAAGADAGAHLLRQHDQEGARHRLRLRAGRAAVRVRQRGRAGQDRPRGARRAGVLPHPDHAARAPTGRCRASSAARPPMARDLLRRAAALGRRALWRVVPCRLAADRPGAVGRRRSAAARGLFRDLRGRGIELAHGQSRRRLPGALPRRRAGDRGLRRGDHRRAAPRISATGCPSSSSSRAAAWSATPA